MTAAAPGAPRAVPHSTALWCDTLPPQSTTGVTPLCQVSPSPGHQRPLGRGCSGDSPGPTGLSLSPPSGDAGMSLGAPNLIPLLREAQIPCLCCQAELQLPAKSPTTARGDENPWPRPRAHPHRECLSSSLGQSIPPAWPCQDLWGCHRGQGRVPTVLGEAGRSCHSL